MDVGPVQRAEAASALDLRTRTELSTVAFLLPGQMGKVVPAGKGQVDTPACSPRFFCGWSGWVVLQAVGSRTGSGMALLKARWQS